MLKLRWPKLLALLFAAAFMLVVAVRLNIEQMFLMSGVLVAVPIVAAAVGWVSLMRVAVRRDAPDACVERDVISIRLATRGSGWSARAVLSAQDTMPQGLETRSVTPSANGTVGTVHHVVARRRGVYSLGPVLVSATDPLGISTFRRTSPLSHRLVVYPFPEPPPADSAGSADGMAAQDGDATGRRGDSVEFHSTREYRDGDELRRIHWPSTARHRRLIVVERQEAADEALMIALDLAHGTEYGAPPNTTLDLACRYAAWAATQALRRASAVGLIAKGAVDLSLPPDRSETQLARIMDRLAHAHADGPMPLSQVLRGVMATGSSASAVLFITALPDDELLSVLHRMAGPGRRSEGIVFADDWRSGGRRASSFAERARSAGIPVHLVPKPSDPEPTRRRPS